ncbi:MAG: hypothetical protein H5T85_07525 [Actinobacteria bacterium]|nr:hypothetical protein [Actinomycetota bacterium]
MDYILGVDGGGTKTSVQISDLEGRKLSESVSKSCNYKSVGVEKAIENLNQAVFSAIEKVKGLQGTRFVFKGACFGLAGNDSEEDEKVFRKIIFNSKLKDYLDPQRTFMYNDTVIGLAAGSDSRNKIILICGTGSNCYGVNEEGREAKANGWDYILADEGSGYEIGLKALKAVMRAYDGRDDLTLLSRTILEDLGLENIRDLIRWTYSKPFSKDRIAALAKTVCRTAEMGDQISIKILDEEASEAVISVEAVARKLNLIDKKFELVFVGNVFKCEKYFKGVLMQKLKKKFPQIVFMPLMKNPVDGAIKLAIEKLRED